MKRLLERIAAAVALVSALYALRQWRLARLSMRPLPARPARSARSAVDAPCSTPAIARASARISAMATNDALPPSDAQRDDGADPAGESADAVAHNLSVSPMSAERFWRLWHHEVSEEARNWRAEMPVYRDAFLYLMGMRRPHFAVLAIPTHLQPLMIALFLTGHHIYVGPTASGTRVHMTIWRPPHPGERPDANDEMTEGL